MYLNLPFAIIDVPFDRPYTTLENKLTNTSWGSLLSCVKDMSQTRAFFKGHHVSNFDYSIDVEDVHIKVSPYVQQKHLLCEHQDTQSPILQYSM